MAKRSSRLLTLLLLVGAAVMLTVGPAYAALPVVVTDPDGDDDDEETEVYSSEAEEDVDDRFTRENPEIVYDDDIDIPIPDFIDISINDIQLNGADWSALRRAIDGIGRRTLSIVHIGDSHIQADINTGTTRDLLQYDYGDAGRGLISPLRLSGTNEPRDYLFTGSGSWDAMKLMRTPWSIKPGFTGTAVKPRSSQSTITLATLGADDYDPFSSILIFHSGALSVTSVKDGEGAPVEYAVIPSADYTQILLARGVAKAEIGIEDPTGDLTIYAASLSGNRPGIFYHAIGNNGATYNTYNRMGNVGSGIHALSPDLVIIELGGNEAFGHLDTQGFYREIDRLVNNVKNANPGAQILLVTPMECQKSVYTTVKKTVKVPAKSKKKKGRKSSTRMVTKTVNERVRSYAVNNNILPLRNEILRYGRDHGIAVYDWYDVSGGAGASKTWINAGLYSSDRVHHTARGYILQGRLFYEALINQLGRNNRP